MAAVTGEELSARLRRDHPGANIADATVTTGDGKPKIQIRTARPGILIGKRGATIEKVKAWLDEIFGDCELDVLEIRRSELEPILLADHVIANVERGVVVDATLDRATRMAVRAGARAARVALAGALGEHFHEAFADDVADFDWTAAVVGHAAVDGQTVRCEVWIALPEPRA
jgi:small subunit ribosomal protein S3